MKKDLLLSGSGALFTLCGLLMLHVFTGTPYRFVVDAGIAVLLLGFGEQMLGTSLLFLVEVTQQLNRLVKWLKQHNPSVNQHTNQSVPYAETQPGRMDMSALLVVVLLLVAGTLSPSDGVDSARQLPVTELLWRALLILTTVATGAVCFLVYQRWQDKNKDDAEQAAPASESEESSRVLETMM